ncbi:MAG: hypothetical protein JOZ18_11850 [Chloroflexi bacterium]|nr:hypothetical protein [Chloroflexota bacterium]
MYQRPYYPRALLLLLVVPLFALSGIGPVNSVSVASRPLALVYRGPAGCPRCSAAVASMLESSKWNFNVEFVGPNESLHLSAALLKTATLYAQPGGNGDLNTAYDIMRSDAPLIRDFVKSGGRYLGFCMGGYLAGATPGFKLLPGDTNEYTISKGAIVKTTVDTTIKLSWRGQPRTVYFQDGPYFIINRHANVTVLARYTNGLIAALVTPYGAGKVGVVGPHPEATDEWYIAHHLAVPASLNLDLAYDLVDTTMQ